MTKKSSTFSRVLGVDVGTSRVGIAVSRDGYISPLSIQQRSQNRAEKFILETVEKENIELIVIGLPLSDNNQPSVQCEDVQKFVRRLRKRTETPIELFDEYASSIEATERLGNRGIRKKYIDDLAACIILEGFLNQAPPLS